MNKIRSEAEVLGIVFWWNDFASIKIRATVIGYLAINVWITIAFVGAVNLVRYLMDLSTLYPPLLGLSIVWAAIGGLIALCEDFLRDRYAEDAEKKGKAWASEMAMRYKRAIIRWNPLLAPLSAINALYRRFEDGTWDWAKCRI